MVRGSHETGWTVLQSISPDGCQRAVNPLAARTLAHSHLFAAAAATAGPLQAVAAIVASFAAAGPGAAHFVASMVSTSFVTFAGSLDTVHTASSFVAFVVFPIAVHVASMIEQAELA
jgi:hypothetical protein